MEEMEERDDLEDECPSTTKRRKLSSNYPKLHSFFLNSNNVDVDKPAVIYDNGKGTFNAISYKDLDLNANLIKTVLERYLTPSSKFIGVRCDLGVVYPSLILGILRSSRGFFNIKEACWSEDLTVGIRQLNLKHILCDSVPSFHSNSLKCVKVEEIELLQTCKVALYEVTFNEGHSSSVNSEFNEESFAYAIQTSGTTGKQKTVLVPHSCIAPNIIDFVNFTWKLTPEDVIFGCAPPTFDPHVVELFSGLSSGATVIYTSNKVKTNPAQLINILVNWKVSILQITPSLFRTLVGSLNLANPKPLSLRIVAFGGEKCPSKQEILLMKNAMCSEIIFQNVYGVTEVSCWASACSIDLSTESEITIGKGLLETEVSIEENEIIISSATRHCFVIDPSLEKKVKATPFQYRTGDSGTMENEGIVFRGRVDKVVKRNGMKISLHSIEEMALSTGLLTYAECTFQTGKIYLFIKLKPEIYTDSIVLPSLSQKFNIPLFMYPDYVISLASHIPLNSNGKIDLTSAINSFTSETKSRYKITTEQIIKTIEPIWRSCTWPGHRGEILSEKFFEVGGDSVSAARFIESTFLSLKLFGTEIHQKYEQILKQTLFNSTFNSVVELIEKIIPRESKFSVGYSHFQENELPESQDVLDYPITLAKPYHFEYELLQDDSMEGESSVFNQVVPINSTPLKLSSPVQLITMFNFNLGLCVDASPAIILEKAIIGCHGGTLICVDLALLRRTNSARLSTSWKVKFPDRLEASVVLDSSGLFGFVGCHDCNLYKFAVSTGKITCFGSCASPIRSKAAISSDLVVVIDSGNCIYCFNSHDMNIIWRQKYSILATTVPLIWRKFCYVTTLDSGLICFDLKTGTEKWRVSPPTFSISNPTLVNLKESGNKALIVIGTVSLKKGKEGLEAINAKTGSVEWTYYATTSSPFLPVFQPIFSKCCGSVISISSDHCLKLCVWNGLEMRDFNYKDESIMKSPCAVLEKDCECILFQVWGSSQLRLVNTHRKEVFKIRPWFMKDFETYSVPINSSEFVLFGGRDNQLHVIKCLSN